MLCVFCIIIAVYCLYYNNIDMNEITIYQNNSKTINVTIAGLDTLTGYTAVLTCKKNIDDNILFEITGTTIGLVSTFKLLPTHTNLTTNTYNYDITISNDVDIYTVVQSVIKIIDSVKY